MFHRPIREDDFEIKGRRMHIKEFWGTGSYGIEEIRIVEEKLKETIKISYHYSVLGFSISDILEAVERNCLVFYYLLPIMPSDLQENIDMLVTEGLIERIGEFDNEIRYRFTDPIWIALANFVDLYDDLFNMMTSIWTYSRSPKKEEKKWFEFFYGNLEDLFQKLHHERSSQKKKSRGAIDRRKSTIPKIHENFEYLDIKIKRHKNQKYKFLIEKLLEYAYPAFMRETFSSNLE